MKRALTVGVLLGALTLPGCILSVPRRPPRRHMSYTALYRPGYTDYDLNGIDDRIDNFLETGGCDYWVGGLRDKNRNGIDDRLEFPPPIVLSPFSEGGADCIDGIATWQLRPGTCEFRYAPGFLDMNFNGIDDRDEHHYRPAWRANVWFGYYHAPWRHHWHGPWRWHTPPRHLSPRHLPRHVVPRRHSPHPDARRTRPPGYERAPPHRVPRETREGEKAAPHADRHLKAPRTRPKKH